MPFKKPNLLLIQIISSKLHTMKYSYSILIITFHSELYLFEISRHIKIKEPVWPII